MQNNISIQGITEAKALQVNVLLPASKSISNRLLLINALAGNALNLQNLSTANDTQLLIKIFGSHRSNINQPIQEINCEDAGTVMRFLTAYFTTQQGQWVLKGSGKMHHRPIAVLVDKLRELGADIRYLINDGFPPLLIKGKILHGGNIAIDASISSQYISALILIAPYLNGGLEIELEGKIASKPYIEMTVGLMQQCGVDAQFEGNKISIPQAKYTATTLVVESDWSAASYWYAFAALAKDSTITLAGLQQNSLQGDSMVANWMQGFGVNTSYTSAGVQLTSSLPSITNFEQDFSNSPDLAPTFVCLCAAMGIPAKFYGLETLAIKESNRTEALATELRKIGVDFSQKGDYWQLTPNAQLKEIVAPITFATYLDHRMAMAFTMFSFVFPQITIENMEVVQKSYPSFWADFEKIRNIG